MVYFAQTASMLSRIILKILEHRTNVSILKSQVQDETKHPTAAVAVEAARFHPTPQSPPPAPHYWSYLERIRCQDNVFLHKRSNYVMKFLNGNPRLCALRCSPVPKVRAFNCMRTTVKPPLWTILNVESDASKKHAGKLFLAFFHCADKKRLVFHPHVVHGAAQSGFQTSGTITAIITLTSLSPLHPPPQNF